MKKLMFMAFTLGVSATALSAQAADLMVAAAMQRCTTNEECQLVTNSCADNCAFIPVNKASLAMMGQQYEQRCGKAMEANPPCNMTPPIAAACINQRCTIDYAFANNASPKDYQSGAYPTAEKATPDQVKGDYSKVDDKKGDFSAYNLPQDEIKEKTLGNITTKVYVPPSAPVSGEQYVPVTTTAPQPASAAPVPSMAAPAPVMAPAAVAPAPAPAPVPSTLEAMPMPTPTAPVTAPVAPTAAPMPAPAVPMAAPAPAPVMPEPAMVPPPPAQPVMPQPAAPMSNNGYVPPPPMTPSMPNQQMPTIATPEQPVPAAPEAQAPVPVPPSDLQPTPTFVPPAGEDVPAVLEQSGTVQPDGQIITPPAPPAGKFEIMQEKESSASKSFTGASKLPSYN